MTRIMKAWQRAIAISGTLVLAALALDAGSPAHAYWCANYQTGGTNCGFSSFDQCRAALSGNGGGCNEIRSGAPAREAVRSVPQRSREDVAKPRRPAEPKAAKVAPPPPPAAAPKPVTATAPAAPPPQAASQTGPGFADARQLVLSGQFEAGLAALRALKFDDHPDVATYIGLATRKLGRVEEAKSWYERALAADSNHKLALSFYGMLRAEQGDIAGAQANLVRIGRICGNTSCNEYQALQGVLAPKVR